MGSPFIFSGNNAKSLKQNLDLNGVVSIQSGSVDPTQTATSGTKGSMYMSTLTGAHYMKLDSSTSTNWTRLTPNGSKNYFQQSNANPDFEANTVSPWQACSTTFTSGVPGTLSLGTGSFTLGINSASVLSGLYDMYVTKPASNCQGSGFASGVLTVDKEDSAKMLFGSFSYLCSNTNFDASGTSTQSFEIWIYDQTSSTWIQPIGYRGMNQNSGVGKVAFSFQTPGTNAINQYRVCVFTNQTSALGYAVELDNFALGPQSVVTGAVITDWTSFSMSILGTTTNPTKGGTIVVDSARWRRLGDSMEIEWSYNHTTAGTAGSGVYKFQLPSGYSIDSSKVTINTDQNIATVLGPATSYVGSAYIGSSYAYDSTSISLRFGNDVSTALSMSSTFLAFSTPAVVISFRALVPIVGWSSNVQLSSDSSAAPVVASGYFSNASITSTQTQLTMVSLLDSHGTMGTNQYVIPSSGPYSLDAYWDGSTGASVSDTSLIMYVDGASVKQSISTQSYSHHLSLNYKAVLKAGAVITFQMYSNFTATPVSTSGSTGWGVNKISGNNAVAQVESVNASYYQVSTQTPAAATPTIINFDTKDFDSHNAVTTGGSWKFVAPYPGKYRVSYVVGTGNNAWGSGDYFSVAIWKNGSVYPGNRSIVVIAQVAGTFRQVVSASPTVNLSAGDYIDLRVSQAITASLYNGQSVYLSIERVGN